MPGTIDPALHLASVSIKLRIPAAVSPEEDIRLAVIAFASRSAQIEAVLGPRASRFHTRLTHLTFDESCGNVNNEHSRVVHPETSAEVDSALRTLEDLVNGPVIFDGLKIPVQLF